MYIVIWVMYFFETIFTDENTSSPYFTEAVFRRKSFTIETHFPKNVCFHVSKHKIPFNLI